MPDLIHGEERQISRHIIEKSIHFEIETMEVHPMSIYLFNRRTFLVGSLALGLALFSISATQAAAQASGKSAPSVSTRDVGNVAAGAVEDTLNACLSRIPTDASTGQRLIAETSCHRDEMDRKIIQAVPETEYASVNRRKE